MYAVENSPEMHMCKRANERALGTAYIKRARALLFLSSHHSLIFSTRLSKLARLLHVCFLWLSKNETGQDMFYFFFWPLKMDARTPMSRVLFLAFKNQSLTWERHCLVYSCDLIFQNLCLFVKRPLYWNHVCSLWPPKQDNQHGCLLFFLWPPKIKLLSGNLKTSRRLSQPHFSPSLYIVQNMIQPGPCFVLSGFQKPEV